MIHVILAFESGPNFLLGSAKANNLYDKKEDQILYLCVPGNYGPKTDFGLIRCG